LTDGESGLPAYLLGPLGHQPEKGANAPLISQVHGGAPTDHTLVKRSRFTLHQALESVLLLYTAIQAQAGHHKTL
jgi:hypothetical protein